MARVPSFVPRTSGQGTGRYAYQKAYSLGFHGTGTPAISKNVGALATAEVPLKTSKADRPASRLFKAPMPTGDMDAGETWETFSKKGKKP
jgi:hypothetical protein